MEFYKNLNGETITGCGYDDPDTGSCFGDNCDYGDDHDSCGWDDDPGCDVCDCDNDDNDDDDEDDD